ncbi:MAG: hypothetical protein E7Z90_07400 [Cyanobacteria bacterium SIG29]|nr:hypothetical protein [Cyanobacteria bacterium SIG29]
MSLQVNSLNTAQNYPNPQMKRTFKANPVVATNALERTPTTDTLVKPTQNKTKKTLLTLGAIVLAGVGIFAAVKAGKAHQQKKAIQEIEKKFADLQNDMPRVQKTFKEVFLREDLTEKEALEMLNRYKDVEKLGITGKKEEYIEAVFKEAKRNFGFENSNIKLEIVSREANYCGGSGRWLDCIEINLNRPQNDIFGTIHHEFRHKFQRFLEVNHSFDDVVRAEGICAYNSGKKEILPLEQYLKEEWLTDHFIKHLKNKALNMYNIKEFDSKRVPNKLKEYAKKCIKANETYIDGTEAIRLGQYNKYYDNFLEVDARSAENAISELFGKTKK